MRKCCQCKAKPHYRYSFIRNKGVKRSYIVGIFQCPVCGIQHQEKIVFS